MGVLGSAEQAEHSAALCGQVLVAHAGPVTCMCADELANTMWLGHADGRISGHSMGDAPGTALNCQQLYCWQVRRRSRRGTHALGCRPGRLLTEALCTVNRAGSEGCKAVLHWCCVFASHFAPGLADSANVSAAMPERWGATATCMIAVESLVHLDVLVGAQGLPKLSGKCVLWQAQADSRVAAVPASGAPAGRGDGAGAHALGRPLERHLARLDARVGRRQIRRLQRGRRRVPAAAARAAPPRGPAPAQQRRVPHALPARRPGARRLGRGQP